MSTRERAGGTGGNEVEEEAVEEDILRAMMRTVRMITMDSIFRNDKVKRLSMRRELYVHMLYIATPLNLSVW